MKVEQLKKLLEKWDGGDEVCVSVPQMAEAQNTPNVWLIITKIDERFLSSDNPEICLIEAKW